MVTCQFKLFGLHALTSQNFHSLCEFRIMCASKYIFLPLCLCCVFLLILIYNLHALTSQNFHSLCEFRIMCASKYIFLPLCLCCVFLLILIYNLHALTSQNFHPLCEFRIMCASKYIFLPLCLRCVFLLALIYNLHALISRNLSFHLFGILRLPQFSSNFPANPFLQYLRLISSCNEEVMLCRFEGLLDVFT